MDWKDLIMDSLTPGELFEVMDTQFEDLMDITMSDYLDNNKEEIMEVLADVFGIDFEDAE